MLQSLQIQQTAVRFGNNQARFPLETLPDTVDQAIGVLKDANKDYQVIPYMTPDDEAAFRGEQTPAPNAPEKSPLAYLAERVQAKQKLELLKPLPELARRLFAVVENPHIPDYETLSPRAAQQLKDILLAMKTIINGDAE